MLMMSFIGINTSHAVITVGPVSDQACDYNSLVYAINEVPDMTTEVIRVVGNNNGYEADGNAVCLKKSPHSAAKFRNCRFY